MKKETLITVIWFWVAMGLGTCLLLLIYPFHIIKLRKVAKITLKDLLWDMIFILYLLIITIESPNDIILEFKEPLDSILGFLSVLLSCIVIYALIKRKLTIFHKINN